MTEHTSHAVDARNASASSPHAGAAAATDSQSLSQRSLSAIWHPCTQMQRASQHLPPLPIVRGKGAWLTDADGNRYFDAISSWWVNLFGHSDAGLAAAISAQASTLPHVMLAGCTHPPAIELAERLSALTDHQLGHVFFASDGASAVEIALKMSFHYWKNQGKPQKQGFICLEGSYHGETMGALAVTDVAVFRQTYDALLRPAHLVPNAAPDSGANADAACTQALAALRRLLEQKADRIAAIILEPMIHCASGMQMYSAAYLRGVRELCDTFGIHWIADEIAVGTGRTGKFFALEHAHTAQHAIWPDLLCLSKGITGGTLALSLVLCSDTLYDGFLFDDVAKGFLHSHSYTGNPLACAAALEVLRRFESDSVLLKLREQATHLAVAFADWAMDERVCNMRQLGMVWACDIRPEWIDTDGKSAEALSFSERFHLAARKLEVLVRPIGHTLYVMPPYLIDAQNSRWLAAQLRKALDAVCRSTPHTVTDTATAAGSGTGSTDTAGGIDPIIP